MDSDHLKKYNTQKISVWIKTRPNPTQIDVCSPYLGFSIIIMFNYIPKIGIVLRFEAFIWFF